MDATARRFALALENLDRAQDWLSRFGVSGITGAHCQIADARRLILRVASEAGIVLEPQMAADDTQAAPLPMAAE